MESVTYKVISAELSWRTILGSALVITNLRHKYIPTVPRFRSFTHFSNRTFLISLEKIMDPTTLPSGNLRLATIRDISRLSAVATAGFFYSPAFTWERRHHAQYPEDTAKSYAKRLADIIRDPERILVVAEDSYQPDENTKTGATIISDAEERSHKLGEKVIVGFSAWGLPPGSKSSGKFMDRDDLTSDSKPVFDGGLGRDKIKPGASWLVYEAVSAEEEKYEVCSCQ